MKRLFPHLLIALILLVCTRCNKTDIEDEHEIVLLKTELGGCHNNDKSVQKSIADTVPYYVKSSVFLDTLDIEVGLSYLCCAPFQSEVAILKDSILITINDTCDYPKESCYCKCICFYTWSFYFLDYEGKEFHYKVLLNSPIESQPVIIGTGSFLFWE